MSDECKFEKKKKLNGVQRKMTSGKVITFRKVKFKTKLYKQFTAVACQRLEY